jgi:hypothetical protein
MDLSLEMNQRALEWKSNNQTSTTISGIIENPGKVSIVDWGNAVIPRSFAERIPGDLDTHYGLETRTLLAQMVTQQLMKILKRILLRDATCCWG